MSPFVSDAFLCGHCNKMHSEAQMCAGATDRRFPAMARLKTLLGTMRVIDDVVLERKMQDEKWGEQNHPDGTGDWWIGFRDSAQATCEANARDGVLTWVDVLREEVFEAFAETDPERLYTELIQASAVAAAWAEAIRRRE